MTKIHKIIFVNAQIQSCFIKLSGRFWVKMSHKTDCLFVRHHVLRVSICASISCVKLSIFDQRCGVDS